MGRVYMAAAGDAGSGGGGGGGAGAGEPAAAAQSGADLATVQRELADLRASVASRDAADKKAGEDAAAKAEADRVAKLSADEQVKEQIEKLHAANEATKAELVTERRASALERMGVLPHFREYAPKVDPKDPAGAAALEKWAKDHPEAIARQVSATVQAIKPQGPLAELLAGKRISPLLSGKWAETLLNKANG
ncbi:MAG: hypothetical protein FJ100_24010 [Deltaproteobacteria bacterium]|nr:hypothetical protein [Deltaproteobacteria bacterium]